MMSIQIMHPSADELEAFATGRLSPAAAEELESHIATCQECCDTLLELSVDDTFAGLLKEASDSGNSVTRELERDDTGKRPIASSSGASSSSASSSSAAAIKLSKHARYELIRTIARGGMGEVFQARHRVMDRSVALKVIKSDLIRDAEVAERFLREVRTAAQLSHPNIVTSYDADQADETHFLVMEFVDGIHLADQVRLHGPLSTQDACEFIRQAALGLQYAHERGMVHRDIKPHNLMLTPDGTVKILDFGLAALVPETVSIDGKHESSSLTSAGAVMGTPDFIAPEQAMDATKADVRSDIYSLGATLYFLLAGEPPFAEGTASERIRKHVDDTAAPISSRRSDISEELAEIVGRMMEKDPDQRYQSPGEVAVALAGVASTPTTSRGIETKADQSKRPPVKRMAAALAAFVFLMGGIFYVQTDKGTLQIDSVDQDVEVTVSKSDSSGGADDPKLTIVDTVTGSKVIRLPSGEYQVALADSRNRYELNESGFKLSRGSRVVINVRRVQGDDPVRAPKPPLLVPSGAQQSLILAGGKLSSDQVKELEAKLEVDEYDFSSRLKLIGYYQRNSIRNARLRQGYSDALAWFVSRYPEASGLGQCQIHAMIDPVGYVKLKEIWLSQVESNPKNPLILSNASKYFLQSDREIAIDLIERAKVVSPNDPQLPAGLGRLLLLGRYGSSGAERKQQAARALGEFETALEISGGKMDRNYLDGAAKAAYSAGELVKAQNYAERLVETGDDTSVHRGNNLLGMLALQSDKVDQACEYLLAAGNVGTAPVLSSFGPNMSLAKSLLEKGRKEVVLQYFELCGKFWKKDKLDQWIRIVREDGMPDFGSNLDY